MQESSPQTFLSYNLRTEGIGVTVAAFATFVAAPFLRPLSAEQWARLGKAFAATVLGIFCWTFIAVWRERQIAIRGGGKLLCLRHAQGVATKYMLLLLLLAF